MQNNEAALAVTVLSAVAGAVHVLAPDHWLPTSVLAWQRGWRAWKVVPFAAAALLLHVVMGALLYFGMDSVLGSLEAGRLFVFSLFFVFAVMLVRMIRYPRMREVLRAGPRSRWGFFAVISLLGPCEAIVPILIKARHLGIGYLNPILSFSLGTLVMGVSLIYAGRLLWNRPFWLPRGVFWAQRRVLTLPVLAVLVLGLSAILRIS